MTYIFPTQILTGMIRLQSLKKAGCQVAEDYFESTCAVLIDLEISRWITDSDLITTILPVSQQNRTQHEQRKKQKQKQKRDTSFKENSRY